MFFAEEVTIPLGFDNWMANLLCLVGIGIMLIHGFRLLQPRPPMDEQLRSLEDRIMNRLDQQDEDAEKRISLLRGHIDSEIARVHARVDSHGQELYRLKGYVEGWRAHP